MNNYTNLSLKEEQITYKLKILSMKKNKILQKNRYKSRKDRGRKLLMIGKEKKERAHKLISKGALIEKAGLLNENKAILGGYFLEFHNCNTYELQRFYEIGIVEFKKHKN